MSEICAIRDGLIEMTPPEAKPNRMAKTMRAADELLEGIQTARVTIADSVEMQMTVL